MQTELTEAVQSFDLLTVPFERIKPLIRKYFSNTGDTAIVNWYCSYHYLHAYLREDEMRHHISLMERLHRLRRQ